MRIVRYHIYNARISNATSSATPCNPLRQAFSNALPLAIQSKRQPPDAFIIDRSIESFINAVVNSPLYPFQHIYKHLGIPHTRTTPRRISRRRDGRDAIPTTATALVEPSLARMLRVVITLLLHLLRGVASRRVPALPATWGWDRWRGC